MDTLNVNTTLSLSDPSKMTDAEKAAEIKLLRDRLKILNATPRSDWHRAFERILRNEARPYGTDVEIRVEQELGTDPPRVDYLILDDMKRLLHGKAIFSIFRQHNICEYKNPGDALSNRVISKIIGYANFYIALAPSENDRPRKEVSISVFRAKPNETLFREMLSNGTLVKTEVPGIYHVKKLTDLPFQIVITSELKGDEYAAYRALSNEANEKDIEIVIDQRKAATDQETGESLQKLIEFYEEKNPGILRRIIGGDEGMASILMDVLKPEIDEHDRIKLLGYVSKGVMSVTDAASEAGMTLEQFQTQLNEYIRSQQQTVQTLYN